MYIFNQEQFTLPCGTYQLKKLGFFHDRRLHLFVFLEVIFLNLSSYPLYLKPVLRCSTYPSDVQVLFIIFFCFLLCLFVIFFFHLSFRKRKVLRYTNFLELFIAF